MLAVNKTDSAEDYRNAIKRMIESSSDLEYLKGVYNFGKHYHPQRTTAERREKHDGHR